MSLAARVVMAASATRAADGGASRREARSRANERRARDARDNRGRTIGSERIRLSVADFDST
jgi:hypothetical protein